MAREKKDRQVSAAQRMQVLCSPPHFTGRQRRVRSHPLSKAPALWNEQTEVPRQFSLTEIARLLFPPS
jgi:hypothetical protein